MSDKLTSKMAIELEDKYGAHNYHPLPVVLAKGKKAKVWDIEGKEVDNHVVKKLFIFLCNRF